MLQREFTEEQHMFRDAYRKFLAAEIVPHMESWREAGIVDREAFRRAGEQGFLMVWPQEKYGGMGDADFRFEQVIIEETAYRDTWGLGLESYLKMMYERLILARELLAGDGSIYIHLDYHVCHYVKLIADEVFGNENFRNEVLARRTQKNLQIQFETVRMLNV